MTPVDFRNLAADAEQLAPWINERREHLHRHPELSFEEKETAAFVRRELQSLGYTPSDSIAPGRHGFFADLDAPNGDGRWVLLRADMDALPIVEENDVPFRSEKEGVGHLCGHDSHTSMLLGAAKLLRERREALPVNVRLVFQHAEETAPGGAVDFVRAGAVEPMSACFGLHVSPRVDLGRVGLHAGPTMAMVGGLDITVKGRGGHAASPHETADPVPAASAIVLALQQIVSRRLPPLEAGVVSVTTIHGGSAFNVVPPEVRIGGTLRTYNQARGPEMIEMVTRIATQTALAWNCEADVRASFSYPPVVNDARAVEASRAACDRLFGEGTAVPFEPSMGAEDFAYFAREKPSSFVFLGVREPGSEYFPLHHPQFLPDSRVFWKGAALLAAMPFVAMEHLGP